MRPTQVVTRRSSPHEIAQRVGSGVRGEPDRNLHVKLKIFPPGLQGEFTPQSDRHQ